MSVQHEIMEIESVLNSTETYLIAFAHDFRKIELTLIFLTVFLALYVIFKIIQCILIISGVLSTPVKMSARAHASSRLRKKQILPH